MKSNRVMKIVSMVLTFMLMLSIMQVDVWAGVIQTGESTNSIENRGDYVFDEEFKTVSNIPEGTSIEEFKSKFDAGYVIRIYQSEIEVFEGTIVVGMIVRIESQNFIREYRVIDDFMSNGYMIPPAIILKAAVGIYGSEWMGGHGVNVYLGGGTYQCVELARRLYNEHGWGNVYAGSVGPYPNGAANIPEGSPWLTQYKPGSGYVPVPGDLVIEYPGTYNAPYGHVAVVDYTDVENNTIYAVEQNGPVKYGGRTKYYYNNSNYTAQPGWGSGGVRMILHAPKNMFENPGHTTPPSPLVGIVDQFGKTVSGWVYNPDAPNKSIQAHIYIWNSSTGETVEGMPINADLYRADLENIGMGNGKHGFSVDIDWSKYPQGDYKIDVYAVEPDNVNLNTLIGTGTYSVTAAQPSPPTISVDKTQLAVTDTITVSWTSTANTDHYDVCYRKDGVGHFIESTTDTSYTIPASFFEPGSYEIYVCSVGNPYFPVASNYVPIQVSSEAIDPPVVQPEVISANCLTENPQPNSPVVFQVKTTTAVTKTALFNESGNGLVSSPAASYVDIDNERIWTLTISFGSIGKRNLTVKIAGDDGIYFDSGHTIQFTIKA